jgi:hypothetical protein
VATPYHESRRCGKPEKLANPKETQELQTISPATASLSTLFPDVAFQAAIDAEYFRQSSHHQR